MRRIGCEDQPSKPKQKQPKKQIKFVPSGKYDPSRDKEFITHFVPKCHHCGVKGHIQPQRHSLETKHVSSNFITFHMKPKHPKVVQSSKFNFVCHHCDAFGHIKCYCHKLNRVPNLTLVINLRIIVRGLKNKLESFMNM